MKTKTIVELLRMNVNIIEKKAHNIVTDYIVEHLDKSDDIPGFEVYTVWKCKALQNWKFLISSTLPDDIYYEVTYNGDKDEWYFDAYKKWALVENRVIKDEVKEDDSGRTDQETE